jgi:hypothetical protein
MYMTSSAALRSFVASAQGKFDLGVANYPRFGEVPRRVPNSGAAVMVFAPEGPRRQASIRLLEFFSRREVANRWSRETGYMPLSVDPLADPAMAAYAQAFPYVQPSIRQMAEILGVPERGELLAAYAEETLAMVDAVLATVPAEARPGVYLARGPEGLESAAPGSINAEIIERAGGRNVAVADSEKLVTASPELVLTWAPDVIVTIDRDFAANVGTMPEWASVPAVAGGRVYLAPSAPFGFIDSPPSVNRLIGLHWLMHQLYPEQAQGDLTAEVQRFYKLFYQVDLDAAQVAQLLGQ